MLLTRYEVAEPVPSKTQLTLQRDRLQILLAVLKGCSPQIRLFINAGVPPSPHSQTKIINITHLEENLSSEFNLSIVSWDKNNLAEVI